ncbi:hypothetical protein HSRCO_0931 [Halanaeroarchaeum sp. HSR-CO]|nr:hypothetical protein HSRCO_0931 [Halanaeroarchaeum sp. HSR-CO]
MDRPLLFGVGVVSIVVGVLPYLGVAIMSEWAGSWAFGIGVAAAFRGYTGGCLGGLLPGVQQCNVDAEGPQNR